MSNVRNTWSQNSSALPLGKNILYMSTNFAGVNLPLGQSCCNGQKQDTRSDVTQYSLPQSQCVCLANRRKNVTGINISY